MTNRKKSSNRKYILTKKLKQTIADQALSPNYINHNYINKKLNSSNYDYESMDETDHLQKTGNTLNSESNESDGCGTDEYIQQQQQTPYSGRPKMFCCNNKNSRHSRPGQAVQIRSDVNGTRTIDHEDEVGQCKISTITLSPDNKALAKKIEYLSDTQLDKITNGISSISHDEHDASDTSIETLSATDCMPTTSKRSQNDLIQFVFTSHGIRVISDKEYVV